MELEEGAEGEGVKGSDCTYGFCMIVGRRSGAEEGDFWLGDG